MPQRYFALSRSYRSSGPCREKSVSRKGREIDSWYSGKKHDFGGNVQGLMYPDGIPMWLSGVLPGKVHDLAAARENTLPALRKYTGVMPCLADTGYIGAGQGVLTPAETRREQGA
jgi:DDE superfamily endonuclease